MKSKSATFDLVLITGIPGSGKSSVANEIGKSLERSAVISGDDVRDLVVGGFKDPAEDWTPDHLEQYVLSFKNEFDLAANFITNGFKVIVEDVIHYGHDLFASWSSRFESINYEKVLLAPSIETIVERNKKRSKTIPNNVIYSLQELMDPKVFSDWKIIDSSDQDVTETVSEILDLLHWK